MRSRYLFLLKTIIASLLAAGSLFAQSGATVSGTVADANGATLPGASVKVTSLRTGIERSVTTNSSGGYTIAQLQPGIYKLTVTLEGFRMTQIDSVELGVDQNRVFDVTLQLGEVSAVVNVTSDEFAAASIDAGSNRLGVNITAREVQEMPVNGRNYSQLYLNAPGCDQCRLGQF